jgi:hypothetical protein
MIINKMPATTPPAMAPTGVFFSGWVAELGAKESCPVGVLEELEYADECDTTDVDTDVDTAVLVVEASANVVVKVWIIMVVESWPGLVVVVVVGALLVLGVTSK